VFPAPGIPIANAGPDQIRTDALGDGFETVALNGTLSHDPDGKVSAYAWMQNGALLKSTVQAKLYLPEGDHYLRLRVTDDAGNSDTDGVRIQIVPPVPHGDNPLRCPGFEETPCGWQITNASVAAGAGHSGKRAAKMVGLRNAAVRQRIG
jgi:hypothetical protein